MSKCIIAVIGFWMCFALVPLLIGWIGYCLEFKNMFYVECEHLWGTVQGMWVWGFHVGVTTLAILAGVALISSLVCDVVNDD